MEGPKVIQHLLRPTDTCVIVVQGFLLGLGEPSHRFLAIVKHESTEEHALFIFEVDRHESPVSVKVDNFYPIKGSFSTEVKVPHPAQCEVLINNGMGLSIALQLSYDSHTAVFISQLNKALHQFNQSATANSPASFSWLLGYEKCRTGWDRFSKPFHTSHSTGHMNSGPQQQFRGGFPDSWPWSHIITPHSDGTTEIARCELLEDFDPLLQRTSPGVPSPSAQPDSDVELTVTRPSPSSSPPRTKDSPFHASDDINPFISDNFGDLAVGEKRLSQIHVVDKGLKHCISDTNLNKLKQEYKPMPMGSNLETLITRSEEDLTATTSEVPSPRHCVAKQTHATKHRHANAKKEKEPEELSKSLFFVKLEENDWVNVGGDLKTSDMSMSVREVRSTETSPTLGQRSKFGSKHKLEFLNPSGIKAITSKANMRSPELSGRNNRKAVGRGRDRSKSAAVVSALGKSSQWVSRYRPGVAVPIQGETPRENIMQSELRHRQKEFCTSVQLRVFCVTWNVNGRVPPFSLDPLLREYGVKGETDPPPPDIFAIGFQELDLSAQCLLSGESNREDMWVEAVEQSLSRVGKYHRVCCTRLVGILLLVFIRAQLEPYLSDVEVDQVATGMHGMMGNKGGVGVHFNLYHSSLCFVNTHLSAHMEEVEKRNGEFLTIMDKMLFNTRDYTYNIQQHDMIFWLGDLNYRITTCPEMTCDQVKAFADAFQFPTLLKLDQLLCEMKKGNVFVGFTEAGIDFKPSYKYDPNTDNWDSSEKHRAPAWCDRILHRGKEIVQCSYNSHPTLTISDHKAVSGLFDIKTREVDSLKEKVVLEQITWRLDKLENDTLPQVDLNVTEFRFKDVKFLIPQSRRLVVTNTGQRPVHISFIPKLDDTSLTKDWLTVRPTSAVIHPLEDAVVEFTVLVDEDSAPSLTTGEELLEDILVLHLEKGKDFFISVSGNYLPSCFGSSLKTLVNLHTYIREVPVATLVDLSSSWEECLLEPRPITSQGPPALDIPKELFAIVDFIKRNGMEEEGLFSGGRPGELDEIRDMLDTGGKDLPGSVVSVGSILITFLSALAEPVVPIALHSRCMDCSNNATLCKQTLSLMGEVHRKTFTFLVDFMKDLVQFSDVNGLEPKILATIFGEVLLRTPLRERKSKSRRQLNVMNRRKATFLYQFIVNDLTSR